MMIKLQKHDLVVTYVPSKFMFTVNSLSRKVTPTVNPEKTFETEMQAYVDLIVKSIPIASEKLYQVRRETEEVEAWGTLKEVTIEGWPDEISSCCASVRD